MLDKSGRAPGKESRLLLIRTDNQDLIIIYYAYRPTYRTNLEGKVDEYGVANAMIMERNKAFT